MIKKKRFKRTLTLLLAASLLIGELPSNNYVKAEEKNEVKTEDKNESVESSIETESIEKSTSKPEVQKEKEEVETYEMKAQESDESETYSNEYIDIDSEGNLFIKNTTTDYTSVTPDEFLPKSKRGMVKAIDFNNVKVLMENAFKACINLKSVTLPDNYKLSAGEFEGCTNLESIEGTLSDENLPDKVFKDDRELHKVNLNIKTIGYRALYNAFNSGITNRDNFWFNSDQDKTIDMSTITSIGEEGLSSAFIFLVEGFEYVKIKGLDFSNCTSFGKNALNSAFRHIELEKSTVNFSIDSVDEGVFENAFLGVKNCDFEFPNVTSIGVDSFNNFGSGFYANKTLGVTLNLPLLVSGNNSFNNSFCEANDVTVKLPLLADTTESMFEGAFVSSNSCTVELQSLTEVGKKMFFKAFESGVDYGLGKNYIDIDKSIANKIRDGFREADDDTWLNYIKADNVTKVDELGLAGVDGLSFKYITNIEEVEKQGLMGRYLYDFNISSITILGFASMAMTQNWGNLDEDISNIGVTTDYSLAQTDITDNQINSFNPTSIGSYTFYNCRSIDSIDVGDKLSLMQSKGTFKESSVSEVAYDDTKITVVGEELFKGTDRLKSFNFEHIYNICREAFKGSAIESIDAKGTKYLNNLIIYESAFEGCKKLKSVDLGFGADSSHTLVVYDKAFMDCSSLTTLNVNVGYNGTYGSLVYLMDESFKNTHVTGELKVGVKGNLIIGKNAFENCYYLQSVDFSEQDNGSCVLYDYAFASSGLIRFVGPTSTTGSFALGGAFQDCTELQYFKTGQVSGLNGSEGFFKNCGKLCVVDFSGNYKADTLPKSAFENCTSIQNINFGGTIKNIGDRAFYNTKSLNKDQIDFSVIETLGSNVFYNLDLGESVNLNNIKSMYVDSFNDCFDIDGYVVANKSVKVNKVTKPAKETLASRYALVINENAIYITDTIKNNCSPCGYVYAKNEFLKDVEITNKQSSVAITDEDSLRSYIKVTGKTIENKSIDISNYRIKKYKYDGVNKVLNVTVDAGLMSSKFDNKSNGRCYGIGQFNKIIKDVSINVNGVLQDVTNITLDKNELTLTKGEEGKLTATTSPQSLFEKELSWMSSDSGVVRVNKDGTIKAMNNGKATITCLYKRNGSIKATCEVTVGDGKKVVDTGTRKDVKIESLDVEEIDEYKGVDIRLVSFNATILREQEELKVYNYKNSFDQKKSTPTESSYYTFRLYLGSKESSGFINFEKINQKDIIYEVEDQDGNNILGKKVKIYFDDNYDTNILKFLYNEYSLPSKIKIKAKINDKFIIREYNVSAINTIQTTAEPGGINTDNLRFIKDGEVGTSWGNSLTTSNGVIIDKTSFKQITESDNYNLENGDTSYGQFYLRDITTSYTYYTGARPNITDLSLTSLDNEVVGLEPIIFYGNYYNSTDSLTNTMLTFALKKEVKDESTKVFSSHMLLSYKLNGVSCEHEIYFHPTYNLSKDYGFNQLGYLEYLKGKDIIDSYNIEHDSDAVYGGDYWGYVKITVYTEDGKISEVNPDNIVNLLESKYRFKGLTGSVTQSTSGDSVTISLNNDEVAKFYIKKISEKPSKIYSDTPGEYEDNSFRVSNGVLTIKKNTSDYPTRWIGTGCYLFNAGGYVKAVEIEDGIENIDLTKLLKYADSYSSEFTKACKGVDSKIDNEHYGIYKYIKIPSSVKDIHMETIVADSIILKGEEDFNGVSNFSISGYVKNCDVSCIKPIVVGSGNKSSLNLTLKLNQGFVRSAYYDDCIKIYSDINITLPKFDNIGTLSKYYSLINIYAPNTDLYVSGHDTVNDTPNVNYEKNLLSSSVLKSITIDDTGLKKVKLDSTVCKDLIVRNNSDMTLFVTAEDCYIDNITMNKCGNIRRLGGTVLNSNGNLFGHYRNIVVPKTVSVLDDNALNLPSENIDLNNVKIVTDNALLKSLDKIKGTLTIDLSNVEYIDSIYQLAFSFWSSSNTTEKNIDWLYPKKLKLAPSFLHVESNSAMYQNYTKTNNGVDKLRKLYNYLGLLFFDLVDNQENAYTTLSVSSLDNNALDELADGTFWDEEYKNYLTQDTTDTNLYRFKEMIIFNDIYTREYMRYTNDELVDMYGEDGAKIFADEYTMLGTSIIGADTVALDRLYDTVKDNNYQPIIYTKSEYMTDYKIKFKDKYNLQNNNSFSIEDFESLSHENFKDCLEIEATFYDGSTRVLEPEEFDIDYSYNQHDLTIDFDVTIWNLPSKHQFILKSGGSDVTKKVLKNPSENKLSCPYSVDTHLNRSPSSKKPRYLLHKNTFFTEKYSVKNVEFGDYEYAVNGLKLDKHQVSVSDAEDTSNNFKLNATLSPSKVDIDKVLWTSDDESVASVDESGNVTINGDGTAQITATSLDGGYYDSCDLTVQEEINGVTINGEDSIVAGQCETYTAEVTGTSLADKSVNWSISGNTSSDTIVDSNGKVTVGLDESALVIKLKATSTFDSTKFAEKGITVKQEITGVKITGEDNIIRGKSKDYTVKVDGTPFADKTVTWTVNDNTFLDTVIDSNGKLTVSNKETAESIHITATSNFDSTKKDTIEVKVNGVNSITVIADDTMKPEESQKCDVTVKTTDDTKVNKDVTWSVDGNNSSETKIDEDGNLKIGKDEDVDKVTVTATSKENPDVSGSKDITIKQSVTSIAIRGKDVLRPNDESIYVADVVGTEGANKSVDWDISNNNSVKTVINADGLVKVGSDESTDKITITAVSKEDPTVKASKEVQIKQFINGVVIEGDNEAYPSDEKQYTVTVDGSEASNKDVDWSVDGNSSAKTVIDENGKLTVGKDETSNDITIKAVSKADPTKSDAKIVLIKRRIDNVVITGPDDIKPGEDKKYTAEVSGTDNSDKTVKWIITDNDSDKTTIDEDGKLSCDKNETSDEIKITAISNEDPTKSGDKIIKVVKTPSASGSPAPTPSNKPNPTPSNEPNPTPSNNPVVPSNSPTDEPKASPSAQPTGKPQATKTPEELFDTPDDPDRMDKGTIELKIPTIKMKKNMGIGNKFQIKLLNQKGAKIKVSSSNKKVASINKKGIVKAKKRGNSKIIINITKGKYRVQYIVKVKVKKNVPFNYSLVKFNTKYKNVSVCLYKLLRRGTSYKISVKHLEKGNKVKFKSSNPKVISVNKKGKCVSHKNGKATITIKMTKGKRTFTYFMVVRATEKGIESNTDYLKVIK